MGRDDVGTPYQNRSRVRVPGQKFGPYTVTKDPEEYVQYKGGFGLVYEATDDYGTRYAVKQPRFGHVGGRASDEELLRAWHAETEMLRSTKSPYLASILDESDDPGDPWAVMQWYEGETLGDRFAQGTPLHSFELHALAWALAAVLAALDRHRLIHRDIKPLNILWDGVRDGEVRIKLIDFGIAKYSGGRTNLAGGSRPYSAPELWPDMPYYSYRGLSEDVYSVGTILIQAATGRPPYRGSMHWDPRAVARPELTRLDQQISEAWRRVVGRNDGLSRAAYELCGHVAPLTCEMNGLPDLDGLNDEWVILTAAMTRADPRLRPNRAAIEQYLRVLSEWVDADADSPQAWDAVRDALTPTLPDPLPRPDPAPVPSSPGRTFSAAIGSMRRRTPDTLYWMGLRENKLWLCDAPWPSSGTRHQALAVHAQQEVGFVQEVAYPGRYRPGFLEPQGASVATRTRATAFAALFFVPAPGTDMWELIVTVQQRDSRISVECSLPHDFYGSYSAGRSALSISIVWSTSEELLVAIDAGTTLWTLSVAVSGGELRPGTWLAGTSAPGQVSGEASCLLAVRNWSAVAPCDLVALGSGRVWFSTVIRGQAVAGWAEVPTSGDVIGFSAVRIRSTKTLVVVTADRAGNLSARWLELRSESDTWSEEYSAGALHSPTSQFDVVELSEQLFLVERATDGVKVRNIQFPAR